MGPSTTTHPHDARSVDICLVVEGTYPLTLGGISTWVDDLVTGLPDIRFALARVGKLPPSTRWAYKPPSNLRRLVALEEPSGPLSLECIEAWSEAQLAHLPTAGIYQAVGAGLAAQLACRASVSTGARLMVSEHASYVQELAQNNACLESGRLLSRHPSSKEQLISVFSELARRVYRCSDAITALYPNARLRQIRHGANPETTVVIPNGVVAAPPQQAKVRHSGPFQVAHVGRVNPLKGTDLFLDAAARSSQQHSRLAFRIVGPLDCEPSFHAQCKRISKPIEASVKWLGPRARGDWGGTPDCLVVPSRSEAQPIVILEAFARGIPVIATDVGDCRRMLRGKPGAHSAPRGLLVRHPDPEAIASAIVSLARSTRLRRRLSTNARAAARGSYALPHTLTAYRQLYRAVAQASRVDRCV